MAHQAQPSLTQARVDTIHRKALDRAFSLGAVYDVTKDDFVAGTILCALINFIRLIDY